MRFTFALLCIAALAGCKVDADYSDNLHVDQLPAEEYRGEIASIDRLLFRPSPLSDKDARDLEQIVTALSKRVANADKRSRFLELESNELELLAKRAGRLSGQPGSKLQDNWMRIRNNLFDDRAWFVRSANDLDYAAKQIPDLAPALNGRWRVTSENSRLSGSIWSFDLPRLAVQDGAGKTTEYTCAVEDGYLALTASSGDQARMRFERNGPELHFVLDDEVIVLRRATPSL